MGTQVSIAENSGRRFFLSEQPKTSHPKVLIQSQELGIPREITRSPNGLFSIAAMRSHRKPLPFSLTLLQRKKMVPHD